MYAVGQPLRQTLPVLAALESCRFLLVGAVAHLHQHAGHGGAHKDKERRALHAAVMRGGAVLLQVAQGILLNAVGKTARLRGARPREYFRQNLVHVAEPAAVGVFHHGKTTYGACAGKIQNVGLKSADARIFRSVHMDGNEKIALVSAAEVHPLGQGNPGVAASCKMHLVAELLQDGSQTLGDVEIDVLLDHAVVHGPRVPAAVSRINDDGVNRKTELCGEHLGSGAARRPADLDRFLSGRRCTAVSALSVHLLAVLGGNLRVICAKIPSCDVLQMHAGLFLIVQKLIVDDRRAEKRIVGQRAGRKLARRLLVHGSGVFCVRLRLRHSRLFF